MDQIEAEGDVAQRGLQPVNGRLHPLRREARGAEERQHAGPAHLFDDLARADAIGHRPRDVRVAKPMILTKRWVAQLFRPARRQHSDDRQRVRVGVRIAQHARSTQRQCQPLRRLQQRDRATEVAHGRADDVRIRLRRCAIWQPPSHRSDAARG